MIKRTTDFVNAETGEVLGSIDTSLNVLDNPDETKLATAIATHLVGYGCAPENCNKPIIVISTLDYGDGKAVQIRATFKNLLGWIDDEEDEGAEEDEEAEEEAEEEDEEEEEEDEENEEEEEEEEDEEDEEEENEEDEEDEEED